MFSDCWRKGLLHNHSAHFYKPCDVKYTLNRNCRFDVSNSSFVNTTPDVYVTFMLVIYLTRLLGETRRSSSVAFYLKLGIQRAIYFCINVTNVLFLENFFCFLYSSWFPCEGSADERRVLQVLLFAPQKENFYNPGTEFGPKNVD